jgi:predicted nucleotidyltransferase
VLTERFHEESDVDFIVDFQPMNLAGYADNYYGLKQALKALLHKPVDLLEEQAIRNPLFREAVNAQRYLVIGKLKDLL